MNNQESQELQEALQDIFFLHSLILIGILICSTLLNKISVAYAKSAESK